MPVRYLSNALGVYDDYIKWVSPVVTLKQPGMPLVDLSVGNKIIKSDGEVKTMDVAPMLKSGRTYLPARWVAEALGYEVAWDSVNSIVLCWPKGAEKPDVSAVVEHITGQTPVTPPETQQPPVNPTGSMEELFSKAKPIEGKPFSFNGWNFDPSIQKSLQRSWDLSIDVNPVIQEVTVADLKPNGIKMGKGMGQIIHDMKVTKDGVTITATDGIRALPLFYLVEEDNVVRYRGGGGYMGQETGTLTEDVKYIHGTGDFFYTTPDLTKLCIHSLGVAFGDRNHRYTYMQPAT